MTTSRQLPLFLDVRAVCIIIFNSIVPYVSGQRE